MPVQNLQLQLKNALSKQSAVPEHTDINSRVTDQCPWPFQEPILYLVSSSNMAVMAELLF